MGSVPNFLRNSTLTPLYRVAALVLSVIVLWASFEPSAGDALTGTWHWLAHFGAYAALGFLWRRALPRAPALAVVAAVAALGFGQEALEIAGHAHPFELADAVVDAAGAVFGASLGSPAAFGRKSG